MKAHLLLLCSITLSTTSLRAVTENPAVKTPEPPCSREGLPPGKSSEKSLYSLDAAWTADVGKVVKLADLLGFPYVPASTPQYAHSLLITVLNSSGEIVFQQSGLGNPRDDALAAVLQLVAPKAKHAR